MLLPTRAMKVEINTHRRLPDLAALHKPTVLLVFLSETPIPREGALQGIIPLHELFDGFRQVNALRAHQARHHPAGARPTRPPTPVDEIDSRGREVCMHNVTDAGHGQPALGRDSA